MVTNVSGLWLLSHCKENYTDNFLSGSSTEDSMACFPDMRITPTAFGAIKWMRIGEELGIDSNRTNTDESLDSITARVAELSHISMADKSLFWVYFLQPFQLVSIFTSSMV